MSDQHDAPPAEPPERQTSRTETVDWSEGSVVHGVIDAVSTVLETEPTALPPLAETVDPDALAALVDDSSRDGAGTGPEGPTDHPVVSFGYANAEVVVRGSGTVTVRPGVENDPEQ